MDNGRNNMDKFLIRKETFHELAKSFGLNADTIEKGRALPDGTVRNWKGVDYIKKNGKWLPKGKGRAPAKEEVKGDKSAQVTDKVDGMKKETSGNDYSKMSKDELIAAYNKTKDMDERDKIMAAFENADKQNDGKSSEKKTEPKDLAGAEDKDMYNAYQKMADDEDKAFYESEAKAKGKTATVVNAASNFNAGQEVEFQYGGNKLSGKITAKGKDGVTIHDKDDNIYHVNYNTIGKTTKNADGTIPADSFNANDYKKSFTDQNVTPDAKGIAYVYSLLGEEGKEAEAHTIEKMGELNKRMMKLGGTNQRFTVDKDHTVYTAERKQLHNKIISEIFTPEKIAACKPKNGETPKYIMFGGRGGSGKSWFTDKDRAKKEGREVMFDSDNFMIIDADEIKKSIPEFEGWNAGEVHEESSYLAKKITAKAKELGLNIIIDGTMNYNSKKPNKVRDQMMDFKNSGYSCEAHYMFLPVQESSKRAINRFKTKKGDYSGRLVPMDILVGMQDNEKSFDSVKDICDNWSFRDNQGADGPKLISEKGK